MATTKEVNERVIVAGDTPVKKRRTKKPDTRIWIENETSTAMVDMSKEDRQLAYSKIKTKQAKLLRNLATLEGVAAQLESASLECGQKLKAKLLSPVGV